MNISRVGPGRLEAIWLKRAHGGPMDPVITAHVVEYGLVGSADYNRYRPVTISSWEKRAGNRTLHAAAPTY